MRIFEKPNLSNDWKCPICGTNKVQKVVLVSIAGTQDGNIIQAEQIHLDCINLIWDKQNKIMYQEIEK